MDLLVVHDRRLIYKSESRSMWSNNNTQAKIKNKKFIFFCKMIIFLFILFIDLGWINPTNKKEIKKINLLCACG